MSRKDGTDGQAADMDAQFTLAHVPDLAGLNAARAEAAAAALARWPVRRGLRYGAGEGRCLNIFPAQGGQGPAPVLFFIHGGFWRSMAADTFSFLAGGFVPFGATLVVIDYPLMPAVRLAEVLDACAEALAWTHAHIADHGGDPERITICGNSAGGHLVAELADAGRGLTRAAGAAGPGIPIAGAVPISGVYDLEPVTRSFQNDPLQLTPEEVRDLSPLARPYRPVVPVIAAVGGDETAEFLRQNRAFATLCAQGQPTVTVEVPGTNHVTVLTEALARPGHPFNRQVRVAMGLAL